MIKTSPYVIGSTWFAQTGMGDLNLSCNYNNEGKVTQITYPTDANGSTPTFTYTYDAMMRLATMTDQSNYTQPVVNGVQYNAANQVTAMNYYGFAETRAYNSLMQLSNITATAAGQTGINVTYNYTAGSNNGKIASATDALSGETVAYQYDALNRLVSAAGSGWAQTQAYDGFGNLIGRTGTGTAQSTTISTAVDAATNRLSGYAYDANGNQISSGYGYDAENRIVSANAGGVEYLYDAQNKRVWQGNFSGGVLTTQSVTLFGADGKMLNTYGIAQVGTTVSFGGGALRAYFGGKLVGQLQTSGLMVAVVQDRLGSVGKYYPYGEERNAPPLANDQVKFATYTRDAATGNDYADQRYYSSALGRFMTPDPYLTTGNGPGDPQEPKSWNRYAYVMGDPVDYHDRQGLFAEPDPEPQPPSPAPLQLPPSPERSPADPPNANSPYPECNKSGSAVNDKTLGFIANSYSDAKGVADTYSLPVAWLLGWAAVESSYGTNPASQMNNNFFSETKSVTQPIGTWTGEVVCPAGADLDPSTDSGGKLNFSCFSNFAGSALGALDSKYGAIIQDMLRANPNVSIVDVFNAVYAAGWDKSRGTTAGAAISGTQARIRIEIDCLKKYGYIK